MVNQTKVDIELLRTRLKTWEADITYFKEVLNRIEERNRREQ